jgi:hypothetical protein
MAREETHVAIFHKVNRETRCGGAKAVRLSRLLIPFPHEFDLVLAWQPE